MPSAPSTSTVTWSSMQTKEYHAHKKKVHTIGWSCGGVKVASGSVDQTARVWTINESGGATDIVLNGHTDSVDQLRWDPINPEVLATASGDKTLRIWDARTGKCAHAIETKGENINLRWSPDGQHISVGDKDDNVSIIETRKCKMVKNIKFGTEVNEMTWDHTGKLFFLTTGTGTVEIYRYQEMLSSGAMMTPAFTLQAHCGNCYCIDFDRKGEQFAVGGADALVSIWDVSQLVCVRTCARLEWPVRTLSFSHDSKFIATGSEDPFIDIADVATGEQAHSVPTSHPMNSMAFHPSKMLLAFAGDDKDRMGRDEGSIKIFGFKSS